MIRTRQALPCAAAALLLLTGCGGGDDSPTAASLTAETTEPDAGQDAGQEPEAGTTPSGTATTPGTTARGELVEGFPTDVIPVLPGVEVASSAVVPGDGEREVSLAGFTDAQAEQLLQGYRDAFLAQGFAETPMSVPAGSLGAAFSRAEGREILTVVAQEVEGRRSFSVGGTLLG